MPDRRKYAGRIAFLPLVVVLVTAGCAGNNAGGTPDPETSPKEGVTVDGTSGTSDRSLACGQPFRPVAGGVLTLIARFPAAASAADRMVTGTVEVTSPRAIRGVVSPRAEVFLVRDGRVVGVPVAQDSLGIPWDLAPGKLERLPGDAQLVSCEPGGGPVPPGDYELYARVVITPDDGPGVAAFGGPWPLRVT